VRKSLLLSWTPEDVEARLTEAADVMRRLPPVRVQGYFNLWPAVQIEFSDMVGRDTEPTQRPPPSPDSISRMERTLEWLRWLEPEDAKLVWMRAEGKPWKAICWRFGMARATANRHWEYALSLIAWRLSGRTVPKKWSRRRLLERDRHLSSNNLGTGEFCVRHRSV